MSNLTESERTIYDSILIPNSKRYIHEYSNEKIMQCDICHTIEICFIQKCEQINIYYCLYCSNTIKRISKTEIISDILLEEIHNKVTSRKIYNTVTNLKDLVTNNLKQLLFNEYYKNVYTFHRVSTVFGKPS
jgi:hypothetical protein